MQANYTISAINLFKHDEIILHIQRKLEFVHINNNNKVKRATTTKCFSFYFFFCCCTWKSIFIFNIQFTSNLLGTDIVTNIIKYLNVRRSSQFTLYCRLCRYIFFSFHFLSCCATFSHFFSLSRIIYSQTSNLVTKLNLFVQLQMFSELKHISFYVFFSSSSSASSSFLQMKLTLIMFTL